MMRSTLVLACTVLLLRAGAGAAQEATGPVLPAGHGHPKQPTWSALCDPPKICVPMPDKKKTTKVTYDCKSEDYCLPRCSCSLLRLFHKNGCGCDQCLECEKPRTRRLLIKYIREEECDVLKCKPVVAPCAACDPAKPELIPAPKAEAK